VAGGKRQEGRFLSDLAAAYGAAVLDRPYREQVALWLNLGRVQVRLANALGLALGPRTAERTWADALAATGPETEELFMRMRMEAKARARGFVPGD
jgi:hypothetical protein